MTHGIAPAAPTGGRVTASGVPVVRRRVGVRSPEQHPGTLLLRQPQSAGHELRVVLEQTPAGPQLVAFVWRQNSEGVWWPCSRGLRVPPADLPAFAAAVGRAVGTAEEPRG